MNERQSDYDVVRKFLLAQETAFGMGLDVRLTGVRGSPEFVFMVCAMDLETPVDKLAHFRSVDEVGAYVDGMYEAWRRGMSRNVKKTECASPGAMLSALKKVTTPEEFESLKHPNPISSVWGDELVAHSLFIEDDGGDRGD